MMTEHSTSIEHASTRRVGRWSLRSFLALGVVLLMFLPTVVDSTTAQEGPSGSVGDVVDGRQLFPMVGEIDFRGGDGAVRDKPPIPMGVDPALNVVVGGSGTDLFLVDTRTFEQVGHLDDLPFPTSHWVLDTTNHRLFTAGGIRPKSNQPTSGTADLLVVDLTGEQPMVHRELEFDPLLDTVAGPQIKGQLAYDPGRDRVYFATETSGLDPDPITMLHALEVSDLVQGPADEPVTPIWSMRLEECGKVVTARRGLVVYSGRDDHSGRDDFVTVGCSGLDPPGASSTGGLSGLHALVRVQLREGEDPSDTSQFEIDTFSFPGNLSTGFAVGDPANDLAYVATAAAGDQKLFVFDLVHGAWTGALSLHVDNTTGTASDPGTGRIYQFNSDFGFLQISEGARVSVPNGTTYDIGVAGIDKTDAVVVDPVTKRLFTKGAQLCLDEETRRDLDRNCEVEEDLDAMSHWRVFEDRVPDAPPPTEAEWDERTEDVADSESTSSQYSGNAQAFGATYTLVGGTRGTRLANPAPGRAVVEAFPVGGGPRHLYFGRAQQAELAGSSFFGAQTAATAAGMVADSQTSSDYGQTGGQWPDDSPDQFRAHRTGCSDFGGSPNEDAAAGSAVVCDSEQRLAQAAGHHTQPDGSSIFQVGYGEATSEVTVDDEVGVISRADSVARDVVVGLPADSGVTPLVRIGEVKTTAQAVAHGTPGTAGTRLEREIRQVVVGPPGDERYECGFGDESCDPYELVRAINELVPARVRAYLPPQDTSLDDNADFRSPDDAVSNGTPGGAKSTVQKDAYEARSDEIINSIGDDEVAGLVIVVYDDHDQPSRHVLHLAAVALDANFFIQSRPTWEPWPGPGPDDVDGGDGDLVEGLPGGGTSIGPAGSRIVTPPPPAAFNLAQDDGSGDGTSAKQTPSAPPGDTSTVADDGADAGARSTSQGEPPALDTVSEPGSDGAGEPAPEVAPPSDEDVADSPQAANEGGPAGLFLTRQRLGQSAPLAALWLLGAAPFYLAIRRRQLTSSSHRR